MTDPIQLCTLDHFRLWGDDQEMTMQHGDVEDGIEPIRHTFNAADMLESASIAWSNSTDGSVSLWEVPKCWVIWMIAASDMCKKGEFQK